MCLLLFQFEGVMEPPIPLKGVVLVIAFGSMVRAVFLSASVCF